ncbi:MAG: gluconate 2-dehydrogenase subunit 3 family protein [Emcibacter sp.]|nr:gluconate 2-dehydrogenase subunit 3 family protein [Emcibacter sp.]
MQVSRRKFSLGCGALTLSFLVQSEFKLLTPENAKAQNIPFQNLTQDQALLIDILGDAIVPGANAAGLSHFIDHQLSANDKDNLLILRYLRVNPPFNDFYLSALTACETAIEKRYNKKITDLSEAELSEFIPLIMQNNPEGWLNAPPAAFFYFVLRSDAIDVTYGTRAGFDTLDIPYMAHIEPPRNLGIKS